MSFVLSFQFHSTCLALRDLYSGLAIMIRMPQSKPCEVFFAMTSERERGKNILPPFLIHTHTHTGNMNQIFMKWAEVLIHGICFLIQAACSGHRHPSSLCATQPGVTESMTTPPRHLSPLPAIVIKQGFAAEKNNNKKLAPLLHSFSRSLCPRCPPPCPCDFLLSFNDVPRERETQT